MTNQEFVDKIKKSKTDQAIIDRLKRQDVNLILVIIGAVQFFIAKDVEKN